YSLHGGHQFGQRDVEVPLSRSTARRCRPAHDPESGADDPAPRAREVERWYDRRYCRVRNPEREVLLSRLRRREDRGRPEASVRDDDGRWKDPLRPPLRTERPSLGGHPERLALLGR